MVSVMIAGYAASEMLVELFCAFFPDEWMDSYLSSFKTSSCDE